MDGGRWGNTIKEIEDGVMSTCLHQYRTTVDRWYIGDHVRGGEMVHEPCFDSGDLSGTDQ